MVDENLIFYTEWELEACVDGALLAEHMAQVNAIPFTYQQLDILKHKLDQVVYDLGSHLLVVPKPFPATWGVVVGLMVNFPGSSTHRDTLSP